MFEMRRIVIAALTALFLSGPLAGQGLAAEPTLRAGLQELEELTRGFAADRARTFTPPAGFTASVLAEVRL